MWLLHNYLLTWIINVGFNTGLYCTGCHENWSLTCFHLFFFLFRIFFTLTVELIMLVFQELIPFILMEQLAMLSSFAINSPIIDTCPTFQINRSNIFFRAKFNYKLGAFAFSIITILNDRFNCKLWKEKKRTWISIPNTQKALWSLKNTLYHLDHTILIHLWNTRLN